MNFNKKKSEIVRELFHFQNCDVTQENKGPYHDNRASYGNKICRMDTFTDDKLISFIQFIAYKEYIWWIYGTRGKKDIRKPIPSCVNKIRNIFPYVRVMVYNLTTSFTSIIYFMYYNITCVASLAARIPLTKKIHNTSYLSTSIHSHAHNTPIIISCQHAPNIHKRLPIQDGCHNQALMNPDCSH